MPDVLTFFISSTQLGFHTIYIIRLLDQVSLRISRLLLATQL